MATKVAGKLKEGLLDQLYEIERQIRQPKGYPFDPKLLRFHMQEAIEGRFAEPPRLTFIRTFETSLDKPTIAHKTNDFWFWFDGVEEGKSSAELTLHKFECGALNASIIVALGGEQTAEVSLADFYATLAEKERVGDHVYLVCYVRDKDADLHTVDADWYGSGWYIDSSLVDCPDEFCIGGQVLSRPPAGEAGN